MANPSWRQFFAQLSDAALIARIEDGLSDTAHAEACDELRSRGLTPPDSAPLPLTPDALAQGDWLILARDLSPAEAHVLAGCLRAGGIAADVGDTHTVSMNWLWSQALGGAKVRVPESQWEEAKAIEAAMRRGELALDEDFDGQLVDVPDERERAGGGKRGKAAR